MKLLSLNTWGGRLKKSIDQFILQHATDVDMFCFQEVYANNAQEADTKVGERSDFFRELQELLPSFVGIFAEQVSGTGLATFVRDTIKVESTDSHFILSSEELGHLRTPNGANYYPRIIQIIRLEDPEITILNFHGVPGNEKRDSAERKLQTQRLEEVLGQFPGEKILVGDFNIRPDTEAILKLEKNMRNLVIENDFKTTRTRHYENKISSPFADYTFVTRGIKVKSFEVLADEVSDHSPMLLDFE